MRARIEFLGDAALQLHFGARIDPAVNARVLGAAASLREAALPGIVDLIPAFATLTVCYDPAAWAADELAARLATMPAAGPAVPVSRPALEIPVCYEGEFAPDLDAVSAHTGLSPAEVVRRHSAPAYRVYFIGFAPGFPYIGGLDPALAVPRRATPRLAVPAGAVAIGGSQTGIYPLATPGGWHLIGRTPLRLFDPEREQPCLLAPGDRLRFVPVTRADYRRLAARPAGSAP